MIFKGKTTYGDFLDSEEKISTNILADRLALLEFAGLITKHPHPDSRAKVLYKLTSKGIELVPAVVEIIVWSEKHFDVHPYAKEFVKQLSEDKEGVIKMIKASLQKQ